MAVKALSQRKRVCYHDLMTDDSMRILLLYVPSPEGRALVGRLQGPDALVVAAATPDQVRQAVARVRPSLFLCDLAAPDAESLLSLVPLTVLAASTPEAGALASRLVERDAVAAYVPDIADIDSAADLLPVLEEAPASNSPWTWSSAFPDISRLKPPSPDPARYRFLEKIGEGASGDVWRARDELLAMDVAIKVLRADLATDSESIQAMKAEARIAMELSHSNLVRLYNFLQKNGRTYLVMEYIKGESFESMIHRYGALDPELVAGVIASCAAGLDYAHRHHVLHRDLKPSNLLFTNDDKLKIIDFGVASLLGPITGAPDEIAGTPQYMSPEQLRCEPIGPASDLYSLGILAYQMLTGRLPEVTPFDPTHPEAYQRGPLVGIPPSLRAVLERATDPDPALRYSTTREFSLAFSAALRESNGR